MIEINPRISTIVYQEDLNLPYLGVKRAIGEISDDELRALRAADPPGPDGAALLRPARVGRRSVRHASGAQSPDTALGDMTGDSPLDTSRRPRRSGSRTAPVNIAGIPWENVQALRREGVDARLVVFNRGKLHPEADSSLDRHGGLPRRLADPVRRARAAAAAHRRLPLLLRPDARAAVAPVPDPARCPQEERLPLPRLRHPRQDARGARMDGKRAGAEIVGSYAALRWVPEAHVVPPGLDLRQFTPDAADRQPAAARRPRAVEPREEGHALRDRGLRAARRRPRHRRGRPPRRGARALRARRHRRRPAERRLARRVRARGDGARQAGRRPPRPGDRRAAAPRASASASRSSPRRRRRSPTRCARSSRARRCAASSAPRAAPTSSGSTTSTGSPTACSRSTLGSSECSRAS